MADIHYHNLSIGIEKLMVFEISRNEYISSGGFGLAQKEAARWRSRTWKMK